LTVNIPVSFVASEKKGVDEKIEADKPWSLTGAAWSRAESLHDN
jgi:hypothetical protein